MVVAETKLVGPYAKGTMMKDNSEAHVVAITKGTHCNSKVNLCINTCIEPPTPAALDVIHAALQTVLTETQQIVLDKSNSRIRCLSPSFTHFTTYFDHRKEMHVRDNELCVHVMVTWLGAWTAGKNETTHTVPAASPSVADAGSCFILPLFFFAISYALISSAGCACTSAK